MTKTLVAGVNMVKFTKPGQSEPYHLMAAEAIRGAVTEAGIKPEQIQQAFGGYVYGDSCSGQLALYEAFQTGIPFINVNNNCSTGSSALFLARQAVKSGAVDCALAFGFEQMQPGALSEHWDDRPGPFDNFDAILDRFDYPKAPLALRCFGAAGHHYMEKYGVSNELFAKVAVKSRQHAANNPFALFTAPIGVEDVLNDRVVFMDFLTRTMCCPPTCGAGAAIVVSEQFAKQHGITGAVEIAGQAMTTDTPESWKDPILLVGTDMTRRAVEQAQNEAGISISDVNVVELHDCFTTNEVVTYEGLGLCAEGEAEKFVNEGNNTYGGQFVVNPSGGLMSKGHPLGATGLAQCYELVNQLRGNADKRQVEGARVALQHNLGLGGAAVVTLYRAG